VDRFNLHQKSEKEFENVGPGAYNIERDLVKYKSTN
jgi:hypothetical protein